MRRLLTFTLSVILAVALASCAGAGPSPEKRTEYERLEKALVDGGTAAIIEAGKKTGCFDRVKSVGGKEVKDCWGAMRPAGKDSKWECIELNRRETPECYEAVE